MIFFNQRQLVTGGKSVESSKGCSHLSFCPSEKLQKIFSLKISYSYLTGQTNHTVQKLREVLSLEKMLEILKETIRTFEKYLEILDRLSSDKNLDGKR